jgi:hypothetical protein
MKCVKAITYFVDNFEAGVAYTSVLINPAMIEATFIQAA